MIQYDNSTRIWSIINSMRSGMDLSTDINLMYSKYFNIDTAEKKGLDNLGTIVGIKRTNLLPHPLHQYNKQYKYNGEITYLLPYPLHKYNKQHKYNGEIKYGFSQSNDTLTTLTDDVFRKIIKMKCLDNISHNTIPDINQIINYIFPDSNSYIKDLGDMRMCYNINGKFSNVDKFLYSIFLPKPCGVTVFFNWS